MASDFHIKFDGVEGEATHKDHKGEIELLSWSWEVTQTAGAATGGGSGRGKATPGEFVISHVYDKASPVLAKHCAAGKHFKDAKLTARTRRAQVQPRLQRVSVVEVFQPNFTSPPRPPLSSWAL